VELKEMTLAIKKQPVSGNWAIYDKETQGGNFYEETLIKANAERLVLCWNSYESDQKLIKDLVKAGKQAIGVINALPKNNYIHESVSAITNLSTAIAAAEKRSK
jgi:hypothetical protein